MTHSAYLKPDALTPELLAQLREMSDKAKAEGSTLADKALRWVLEQRGVTSVLVGISKTEQMERNLRAVLN